MLQNVDQAGAGQKEPLDRNPERLLELHASSFSPEDHFTIYDPGGSTLIHVAEQTKSYLGTFVQAARPSTVAYCAKQMLNAQVEPHVERHRGRWKKVVGPCPKAHRDAFDEGRVRGMYPQWMWGLTPKVDSKLNCVPPRPNHHQDYQAASRCLPFPHGQHPSPMSVEEQPPVAGRNAECRTVYPPFVLLRLGQPLGRAA